LWPIHHNIAYDNAVRLLDRLAVLDKRNRDQGDYPETHLALVERYDDEHFAIDDAAITPIASSSALASQ